MTGAGGQDPALGIGHVGMDRGYFAVIRWLRRRNLEEANDNREEGGEVRGCIHQLARSKQTCVQLAS